MKYNFILQIGEERYPLQKQQTSIGRNVTHDIILQDPSVSSFHAVIKICDNDCNIIDKNSTNGTFVNGRKLESNRSTKINKGDEIIFGMLKACLVVDSPSPTNRLDTGVIHSLKGLQRISERYTVKDIVKREEEFLLLRAHDIQKNIPVVVKLLNEDLIGDTSVLNEFKRECSLVSKFKNLQLPSLPKIINVEADEIFYYVMENFEGNCIDDCVKKAGPIPAHYAINIIIQLSQTLCVLHNQFQIVYRDIRPKHIVITPDFVPKLYHFSSIKAQDSSSLTNPKDAKGSPLFTAPEVSIQGAEHSKLSDIYSLGITLYYMLKGNRPFNHPMEVFAYFDNKAPCPHIEEIPDINMVFAKMIARNPNDRFQDYHELVEQLVHIRSRQQPYQQTTRITKSSHDMHNTNRIVTEKREKTNESIASKIITERRSNNDFLEEKVQQLEKSNHQLREQLNLVTSVLQNLQDRVRNLEVEKQKFS